MEPVTGMQAIITAITSLPPGYRYRRLDGADFHVCDG